MKTGGRPGSGRNMWSTTSCISMLLASKVRATGEAEARLSSPGAGVSTAARRSGARRRILVALREIGGDLVPGRLRCDEDVLAHARAGVVVEAAGGDDDHGPPLIAPRPGWAA